MKKFNLSFFFCLLIFSTSIYAKEISIQKTTDKLNQLKIKINNLEQKLNKSYNKQKLLTEELTKTNKQINYYLIKSEKIEQNITLQENSINQLTLEIDELTKKLNLMQENLTKYLLAKYKTDKKESLKWLLNQENIHKIDGILTYYEYLIAANKKLIGELKITKNSLDFKKIEINKELNKLNHLKKQWQTNLITLNNDKKYHATLIKKLNNDITKKQKDLEVYRQNQANLTKLISQLTKKSVLQTRNPLTSMKKKLTSPVQVTKNQIQNFNQGVIFYAPEGTSVHAISPGKVVFSNWLNGYGLLLIIDHGWGFMSLYANNSALFKHIGDSIRSGEKIAKIGHSGVFPKNGLYFEIRHHGKAIPPLEWLQ